MSCGPMNNLGLTNNNIGTSNLMQVYPPQSQPRTNNPFSYNLATSVNQNGSNFTPMSSSFENSGSHFNNVNQFGIYWLSSCSAGFKTGASSAYQFPYEQDNYQPSSQQQDGGHDQLPYQVEVPDPAANPVPTLLRTMFQTLAKMEVTINFLMKLKCRTLLRTKFPTLLRTKFQTLAKMEQQDGGHESHDQLPYQVEVPDPAANQVPNPSADQVPNPGPYYVEDGAPNGTISEPGVRALSQLDDNIHEINTC
ncbi:putative two-component response regulator ARR21 [Prunus yedoensis var. nudiflora]|uniref:Putative two-component response regulator ARR21 n=1 Tax=Prunus yedoensis var. nudiflora TaxID=2094558 RepID=A0A314YUV7_PRUYE|nr:putative two-component response regulator ARR21 [Prunus yedoensis var. nudiflora]